MPTATPAERAFWDASGVILLCAHQPSSAAARRIRTRTGQMAVWWGTLVEVWSALHRLHREGGLSSADLAATLRRLATCGKARSRSRPRSRCASSPRL